MKTLNSILIFLLISVDAFGEYESAISELNADLVPIYESLMTEGQSTDLVGKHLELNLNLKHSSDRYLLFTDTRIVLDKDTKYYLIKWKFRPNDVKALFGKSNVKCKVKGRIVEVIKGATSPRMPYVIVEVVSVEL
jgi:hypothetical protein